jgi:purine-nucleoside phosphorylase
VVRHPEEEPVEHAASRFRARFGAAPATAIVLGSGLGSVVARVEIEADATFPELGLPESTVAGHLGRALRGNLGGGSVIVLSGRVHMYEGYGAGEVVRAVRALHRWGVRRVLLTCSAGGISAGLEPGALVSLTDHVNLQGENPLRGPPWGSVRFPDMTFAYHPATRQCLKEAARTIGIPLIDGVYAAMMGPSYETPAEIRMLRTVGADVVGMSTVPEVLAAAQVGMPAAAIAVVSNPAAGLASAPLTHDEVTEIAGRAADGLARIFEVACGRFDA